MKYLIVFVAIFCISFFSCNSNKLPREAKELLFKKSDFSKEIFIEVPSPASKERYEDIVNNPVINDYGLIPTTTLTYEAGKSLDEFDKLLLTYLVRNEFLEIKTAQQTTVTNYSQESKAYKFALYTPLGQNQLVKNAYEKRYYMKGGTRKLKSIDFENSYKQNFGIEVRIYSVKFSYTIDPLLPDLGGIKKQIYIGEAQLYKDPNNGEWKIQKLSLNQDEQSDLLKIIMEPKKKTDYEIYDSLAYVFYMSNMPDSALFYWSKGLKINPNFHQAYSNRGTVLSNSFQRYDEALHDFNKAIELNSKGDYYLNRSITYFKMGNIELAKKDALEAKRLGTKISEAYAIALKIN